MSKETSEHLKYRKDIDVIPVEKREQCQKELDDWYRVAGVSWSQTVICECGRLSTAYLMYSKSGPCSICNKIAEKKSKLSEQSQEQLLELEAKLPCYFSKDVRDSEGARKLLGEVKKLIREQLYGKEEQK